MTSERARLVLFSILVGIIAATAYVIYDTSHMTNADPCAMWILDEEARPIYCARPLP